MSLEIWLEEWKHPEGKEYLNCVIRDENDRQGKALHVTMWGKHVDSQMLDTGQAKARAFANFQQAAAASVKESDNRTKRGYVLQYTTDFRPLRPTQEVNLDGKGVTMEWINGGAIPAFTKVSGVVDEDLVVPVPTASVTASKRVEWVMNNPDHPEAFSQMMQAAGQLTKVSEDAQARAARAKTDLEFAKAWMASRMAQGKAG